jgi:hypothetical protein
LNAYCNTNDPSYDPAGSIRGAQFAPRPPGDTTVVPPSSPAWGPITNTYSNYSTSSTSNGSKAAASPVAQASASYDPVTALLMAPNGQVFTIGSNGGQSTYFGSDAWKWLLIAPTAG